jgi:CRISPR/Cas system CSM-associated protein Csm3 (group 7 of RAMP superfamily)
MSLQEVKEQVFKLSVSDRLALVNLIVESLQTELNSQAVQTESSEQPSVYIPGSSIRGYLRAERTTLINRMRGFLKIDKPAPTDSEVQSMLEERLAEKYLQ